MWHCPLCKTPISLSASPIRCENNHSFDKSKAGYVNLLPVQFKRSKAPGDDKAMVRARKDFHQRNTYLPLKDRMIYLINEALSQSKSAQQNIKVYDAGCGEGSYLSAVVSGLHANYTNVSGAGSDISKIAVEIAAKTNKHLQFVVASSFELPLEDASQDIIIQVFAPGSNKEYLRTLRKNGVLITVDPAPQHLMQLKKLIYDKPKEHTLARETREGFSLVNSEVFQFAVELSDDEHALSLVKMTPFYWTLPKGKIDTVISKLRTVSADFHIQVWRKNAC